MKRINAIVLVILVPLVLSGNGVGRDPAGVQKLIDTVKDEDLTATKRVQAIRDLGAAGKEAKAAVPTLLSVIGVSYMKLPVIQALGQIGEAAQDAKKPLLKELESATDGPTIELVFRALSQIGAKASELVPPLTKILVGDGSGIPRGRFKNGVSYDVQMKVLAALEKIGPPAKAAVPAVVRLLEGWPGYDPRTMPALKALRAIGSGASEARPVVRKFLTDANSQVAALAEETLTAIKAKGKEPPKPADPKVGKESKTPEETRPLSPPKPKSSTEIDLALLEQFRSGDSASRAAARVLLRKASVKALPVIEKGLADADLRLRVEMVQILGQTKLDSKQTVPLLLKVSGDSSPVVRRAVAVSLRSLGTAAREAIPTLTRALRDPDREVRLLAAYALEAIE